MIGLRALRHLREEYQYCEKCPLLCDRLGPVFGSGSATADIVIVGEAPGEKEDQECLPFVGKSGRLLLQLIEKAWPDHDERMQEARECDDDVTYYEKVRDVVETHVFLTNTILCRPTDNRTPATSEIKECRDRLHKTIYAIDPTLVIAAGKTAASTLLGKNVAILNKRGTIFDIAITSPVTGRKVRYPMLAILHPSYLLRKGDKTLVRQKKGDTYQTIGDLRYGLEIIRTHYSAARNRTFPI